MTLAEPHPADEPSVPTDAPAAATTAPRQPSRRWFQFRLRTLMVFMVVVSILLAGFAWRLQRARRQAEAVAKLRKLDDCVAYEAYAQFEKGDPWPFNPDDSYVPAFLRNWLGDDFFYDADQVRGIRKQPASTSEVKQFWEAVAGLPMLRLLDVDGEWMDHDGFARLRGSQEIRHVNFIDAAVCRDTLRITGSFANLEAFYAGNPSTFGNDPTLAIDDRAIAELDGATRLWFFALSNSRVTEKGLRHFAEHHPSLEQLYLTGSSLTDDVTLSLGKLSELKRIHLRNSQITDEGLASLSRLLVLEELFLESPYITDQGLIRLQGMAELRHLTVDNSAIDGTGVRFLRGLPKLRTLSLEHSPVTNEGLNYVKELPVLESLDIGGSNVTDDGIVQLKLSPNLIRLYLYDTQITDRALAALAQQTQLTDLDVRRTKVTAAGVVDFKKAIPTCDLRH